MKEKPKNPYQRLLDDVKKFACSVKYAHRKVMWVYPKGRLKEGWKLDDLYERAKAADQLGYDVRIVAGDDGLRVEYVKRADVPYSWA